MDSWAVWLVIIVFLVAIVGIIVWFALDNNIPGGVHTPPPPPADNRFRGESSSVTVKQPLQLQPQ